MDIFTSAYIGGYVYISSCLFIKLDSICQNYRTQGLSKNKTLVRKAKVFLGIILPISSNIIICYGLLHVKSELTPF